MTLPPWIAREELERRRLAPQLEALARATFPDPDRARRRQLVLRVWAQRPAAWGLEHAEREAERTRKVGRAARALLELPNTQVRAAFTRVGANTITAADVIAYRTLWTPYMAGMIAAMRQAAQAFTDAAAGKPSAVDLTIFAAPPSAVVLQTYADGWTTDASTTSAEWDAYAGWSDADVVLQAGSILTFFQKTVLGVSQTYVPQLQHETPSIALPTQAPAFDVQTQVIATIEGYGVLGKGVLQLLGIGAGGALKTYGAIAKDAHDLVKTLASPGPWIAVGVLGLAILVARR